MEFHCKPFSLCIQQLNIEFPSNHINFWKWAKKKPAFKCFINFKNWIKRTHPVCQTQNNLISFFISIPELLPRIFLCILSFWLNLWTWNSCGEKRFRNSKCGFILHVQDSILQRQNCSLSLWFQFLSPKEKLKN